MYIETLGDPDPTLEKKKRIRYPTSEIKPDPDSTSKKKTDPDSTSKKKMDRDTTLKKPDPDPTYLLPHNIQ